MKIMGVTTADFDFEVGESFEHFDIGALPNDDAKIGVVKEIKYFETSQVYNKFIHEPIYVIECTEGTTKLIVPVRAVTVIRLDTKKEEAIKPDLSKLGE